MDWKQALQYGYLDQINSERTQDNIDTYGLDEECMTLIYEDEELYVINYNDISYKDPSSLHFINFVRKDNCKIVETVEL